MTFQVKDRWNIPVTAVADEFIDHYMAAANGEYVKVYLYILRHQSEPVSVDAVADALNHTESDVRRALAYWEKAGVLLREEAASTESGEADVRAVADQTAASAALGREAFGGFPAGAASAEDGAYVSGRGGAGTGRRSEAYGGGAGTGRGSEAYGGGTGTGRGPEAYGGGAGTGRGAEAYGGAAASAVQYADASAGDGFEPGRRASCGFEAAPDQSQQVPGKGWSGEGRQPGAGDVPARFCAASPQENGFAAGQPAAEPSSETVRPAGTAREQQEARPAKPVYSVAQVNRLSGDEEFAQILYIAQKYMNKVFTPRDCQVFAYLYDTLKFSPELLEYLVEYCVQNGHVSVRYMETVAINWHEQGFKTPDEAKEYAEGFNNDAFSVMKAFGLNDRRPATEEQKMITKWFREYGFGRELVLMACNRTISAIHTPSFRYADKILSDWKLAGVRTRADVEAMDEKRTKARAQVGNGQTQGGRGSGGQNGGQGDGGRRKSNQFHNFKQRDTDYDALVLKQLKERVNQQ